MKTSSLKPSSVSHYNSTQRRVFQSHLGSNLLNSEYHLMNTYRKQNPQHRKPKVASALWRGLEGAAHRRSEPSKPQSHLEEAPDRGSALKDRARVGLYLDCLAKRIWW